jgi:hypothetical protein
MTSFTLRQHKRYRVEIKMGSGGGMVPNSMIAKNIQAFGFIDVRVVGSGRNRIAEGTWVYDDLRVRITTTKCEIDRSKPEEFPLAALLQGIADAEGLQPPKEIPSKGPKRTEREEKHAAQKTIGPSIIVTWLHSQYAQAGDIERTSDYAPFRRLPQRYCCGEGSQRRLRRCNDLGLLIHSCLYASRLI